MYRDRMMESRYRKATAALALLKNEHNHPWWLRRTLFDYFHSAALLFHDFVSTVFEIGNDDWIVSFRQNNVICHINI